MTIPPQLLAAFSHNQFLQGGAVLGIIGGLAAYARAVPSHIAEMLRRKLIVTVEVESSRDLYNQVLDWFNQTNFIHKRRLLSARIAHSTQEENGILKDTSRVKFTLAPGNHMIWYKHRPVWVTRDREKSNTERLKETIYISYFGRTQALANELFTEIHASARTEAMYKLGIYQSRCGWEKVTTK